MRSWVSTSRSTADAADARGGSFRRLHKKNGSSQQEREMEMMKRLTILALLMQIPALTAFGETKEGSCQLKEGGEFDNDVFTVHVGEKIKGTCKFYIQDFFKQRIVNANIAITNTSDKAMHCQYYVAFFDKDGKLVGCAGQGTFDRKGLAAGETTQLGSCLIPLPAGLHEKAVQYKIAFYESDQQIGKADRESRKAVSKARTPGEFGRKWTDATGSHTVEAEMVDSTGGTVRLKTKNGQIISLSLEKLSDADQRYVRRSHHIGKDAGGTARPAADGQERPQQGDWFSAGPGWKELAKVAGQHQHRVHSFNHSPEHYQTILSKSKPGSTIILLFALDHADKDVPEQYKDLLPMPWDQIEAGLKQGGTVEAAGKSRGRRIVLLAAPTESELNKLIHNSKYLAASPPDK